MVMVMVMVGVGLLVIVDVGAAAAAGGGDAAILPVRHVGQQGDQGRKSVVVVVVVVFDARKSGTGGATSRCGVDLGGEVMVVGSKGGTEGRETHEVALRG